MKRLALLLAVLGTIWGTAVGQTDEPSDSPTSKPTETATSPASIPQAWREAAQANARWTDEGWFAPTAPEKAKPRPAQFENAFVIPFETEFDKAPFQLVKYQVAQARSQGADLIIFRIDSPGGRGDVMNAMIDMVDDLDIYTVAWVKPDAYSAAAVFSLSCDTIVMTDDAIIGDAMPILIGSDGIKSLPTAERAKLESPMRTKIRDMATKKGQNADLWEAMVHAAMTIWLVRNEQTGELEIVDADEWKRKQEVTSTPEWKYLTTIDDQKQLVTLTTDDAVTYGLSETIIPDEATLNEYFHIQGTPTVLTASTMDRVGIFLLSPAMTGLLIMGLLVGIYFELKVPGLSIFGALAALCLVALVGSRFLIGLANPVEVALLAVGILLVILEVFVIPGFGVAGIAGISLILLSLLAMLIPNDIGEFPWPKTAMDWTWLTNGIMAMLLAFVGSLILAAVAAKYLPQTAIARRCKLVLVTPPVAPEDPNLEGSAYQQVQVGEIGTTVSILRPVGEVRFGTHVLAAIADGQFIDRNSPVRVLRHDGNRLVVEPLKSA